MIRGFESINAPANDKNSNAPAPIRPEAVRPQIVEAVEKIQSITGKTVQTLHEVDIIGEATKRPRSESEATLHQHPKRARFGRYKSIEMRCDEKEPEVQQYTHFFFPVFVICILGYVIFAT